MSQFGIWTILPRGYNTEFRRSILGKPPVAPENFHLGRTKISQFTPTLQNITITEIPNAASSTATSYPGQLIFTAMYGVVSGAKDKIYIMESDGTQHEFDVAHDAGSNGDIMPAAIVDSKTMYVSISINGANDAKLVKLDLNTDTATTIVASITDAFQQQPGTIAGGYAYFNLGPNGASSDNRFYAINLETDTAQLVDNSLIPSIDISDQSNYTPMSNGTNIYFYAFSSGDIVKVEPLGTPQASILNKPDAVPYLRAIVMDSSSRLYAFGNGAGNKIYTAATLTDDTMAEISGLAVSTTGNADREIAMSTDDILWYQDSSNNLARVLNGAAHPTAISPATAITGGVVGVVTIPSGWVVGAGNGLWFIATDGTVTIITTTDNLSFASLSTGTQTVAFAVHTNGKGIFRTFNEIKEFDTTVGAGSVATIHTGGSTPVIYGNQLSGRIIYSYTTPGTGQYYAYETAGSSTTLTGFTDASSSGSYGTAFFENTIISTEVTLRNGSTKVGAQVGGTGNATLLTPVSADMGTLTFINNAQSW